MSKVFDFVSGIGSRVMLSSFVKKRNKGSLMKEIMRLMREAAYRRYAALPPEKYPYEIAKWYTRNTKKPIDIENPVTYNEKLQWLKLHASTREKGYLSDKYAVRKYIADKIGEEYLIPLLGVYDSFDDIDFDALPKSFVLKANHGSGWNIIVKDKDKLDKAEAKKKFDKWMSMDFSFRFGFQLHYGYIDRKIVCEEYFENENGLDDYKILCFHGKPYYIWKDVGRYEKHCRNLYDTHWNLMDVLYGYPNTDEPVAPPKNLDKMMELAAVLSEGFSQVRVDFYEVNGRIYFGELTFTSTSGTKQFTPENFDAYLGTLFDVKTELKDYDK